METPEHPPRSSPSHEAPYPIFCRPQRSFYNRTGERKPRHLLFKKVDARYASLILTGQADPFVSPVNADLHGRWKVWTRRYTLSLPFALERYMIPLPFFP